MNCDRQALFRAIAHSPLYVVDIDGYQLQLVITIREVLINTVGISDWGITQGVEYQSILITL